MRSTAQIFPHVGLVQPFGVFTLGEGEGAITEVHVRGACRLLYSSMRSPVLGQRIQVLHCG